MGIKMETHKRNLEESLRGMVEQGLKEAQILRVLNSYMRLHGVHGEAVVEDGEIVINYR